MKGVIVQKDECASDKTLPKELQCRYLRRRAIHIEVEVGDATGISPGATFQESNLRQ